MTCLKNISCTREHFRRSFGVVFERVQECLEAAACATSLHREHGGEIEGCSAANTGQNRMRAEYVIRGIFGALVRRRGIRGVAGR